MKKTNLLKQLTLVMIVLQFSLTSCHNFYKATSTNYKNNTEKTEAIDKLKSANKIFILRSGASAYEMKNLIINNEKTMLECTLDTLSEFNKLHLTKGKRGNMQYKKNWPEHNSVLNEVHVYVTPGSEAATGKYTLALDKIQKVEVIEKDKNRTTGSYVLGGIGYTVGILIVASIVAGAAGAFDWNWGN